MRNLRVLFMGTPEFSVNVLEGLIENYNVVGVVTQPDKEIGRKKEIKYSPVKEVALENNIEVLQPIQIREEYDKVIALKPDIIITCAYGQIIPKEILNYPKYGCINVHASLLPKLRGGAPIHRAIIDGYSKTGITVMYMDEGMDTGDIISCRGIEITNDMNVGVLHDKLSIMGKNLLLATLPSIIDGTATRTKQNEEEVTFAYNIKREDELIDFNKTAMEVYNHIRGLNPFPGGYATLNGKVIKIYNARITDRVFTEKENGEITNVYKDGIGVSVKDYEIVITELKVEGKKKMSASSYLNGIDKFALIGKVFNKV